MMDRPKLTVDHTVIRRWLESRGGIPALLTGKNAPTEDEGVLRVYFDDSKMPDDVIKVSWAEFFTKFDQSHLAFLFEEDDGGKRSKFFKFISRNGE